MNTSMINSSFSLFKRDAFLYVSNFAIGILIARMIGPSILGIWGLINLIPTLAEGFARIKVDQAAVYFIGKNSFKQEDIYMSINIIAIASSTLIIILIVWQFDFIYNWFFRNEKVDYRIFMFYFLIQIPLQFLYMNHIYFHIALENIKVYNYMLIIQAWSYSLLSLFLLFFVKIGLWSLLLSTLISTFLSLLFGFFCLKRRFWISGNIRKRVSFSLLRYGLHFYIGGVLGQLQQYGTQLLSVTYLVPSQMAFLNQGQSVGKLLNKLVDPLNTLLYPRICKSDDIQAVNISTLTFRISVIILFSFAILFAIIAKPLVLTLYGISFSQTVTIIYYLLPGVFTAGISSTLVNYFLGTGRAKLIPRIQIIPVFIQLFLAWEFTKKWGLQGAAISISITSIIYSGIIIVLFIKVTKISIVKLFPLKKDFILIFSNVILLIRNRNK